MNKTDHVSIVDAIINKTKNNKLNWYDTKNIEEITYKNKNYTKIFDKDGHYLMAKFILRKIDDRVVGTNILYSAVSLIIEYIDPVHIKNDTDKYAKRMVICESEKIIDNNAINFIYVLYDNKRILVYRGTEHNLGVILFNKLKELSKTIKESIDRDISQSEKDYIMETLLYSLSKDAGE